MFATRDQLPAALADLNRAVELEPKNPLYFNLRGQVYLRLGKFEQAIADCTAATTLAPSNSRYWYQLGVARYRAGRWQGALEAREETVKLNRGTDRVEWFFLAMTHARLGHREQARSYYDRAVVWMEKNRPQDAELRRLRAEAAELLDLPVPAK